MQVSKCDFTEGIEGNIFDIRRILFNIFNEFEFFGRTLAATVPGRIKIHLIEQIDLYSIPYRKLIESNQINMVPCSYTMHWILSTARLK